MTCDTFEARVADYLEAALSPSERAAMEAHMQQCEVCAALVADLEAIVRDAGTLPLQTPSRDLWPDIARQIEAPTFAIGAGRALQPSGLRRVHNLSVRWLAVAATLLVATSSGVTFLLVRNTSSPLDTRTSPTASIEPSSKPALRADLPSAAPAPVASTGAAADVGARPTSAKVDSLVAPQGVPKRDTRGSAAVTHLASRSTIDGGATTIGALSSGSVEFVYEREFAAMRRIVDARLGDLDSATVVEIERNLAIIDKAIRDSRRALRADPHSGFLSSQLDRALENKLEILRRVALL